MKKENNLKKETLQTDNDNLTYETQECWNYKLALTAYNVGLEPY